MTLMVSDLAVVFDNKEVFSQVSFDLAQGQIGCLLGQSGCGKTTVLRSIMGFCSPKNGKIALSDRTLFEANMTSIPAHMRHIGMVFQDYALFGHLTVADNICFGIQGLSKSEKKNRLNELLTLVDMTEYAKRYPHELSGGQQQRVALARAFAMQPALILLDEPFSNLDVELRASLSQEVRALLKSQNMTAILVTHDQAEAFSIADVVGVMANGRLQQWDTPINLYQYPVNQTVATFVGEGVLLPIYEVADDAVLTAIGKVVCHNAHTAKIDKKQILIRPEMVQIKDDGMPAILIQCDFKGGYWQATLQLTTGEKLLARLPIHTQYKIGQTLGVYAEQGWVV